MSLYGRVIEGVQRLRRTGKVSLGEVPEDYLKLTNPVSPRRQFPGNFPTKVEPHERDPKLDYKIAAHLSRSVHGPHSAGREYRKPEHVHVSPPLRTKALKRKELLVKRKELQRRRASDQGEG